MGRARFGQESFQNVSEHRIRLRGPWEAIDLDSPSGEPFRLALPFERLPDGAPRRLRLIRKFGRPRMAEDRDSGASLTLALEDVDGLTALFLNDEPLTWRRAASGGLIVELPPLRERNALRLDVDLAPAVPGGLTLWGSVAIVIPE